jgi:ABC-type protease/lipase transport system fused ATPase/permease subunit
MHHIEEAARLGGAEDVIKKLPEGFDTYLTRPVQDQYSSLPEGTVTLFGREVNYSEVRGAMGEKSSTSLSGGQMQRIAL